MRLIAEQPYIKVQREVNSIQQKNVKYERTMYLFEDKLVTKRREFPINQVFDMSYRLMSHQDCILYVHTSQGVFSYPVKSEPKEFIQAFKLLEKNREM